MEKMFEKFTFNSNNGKELEFTQYRKDGFVSVSSHDGLTCEYEIDIPASDFVMLWNLYRYIKKNDIKNEWINPDGKKEEHKKEVPYPHIYYSKEARETATEIIGNLVGKLANTTPTEQWNLSEISGLMYYLGVLKEAIKGEQRYLDKKYGKNG